MSPSVSYPGVYAARVYNNRDPSSQGRVQMLVPQIFGATPVAIWAPPLIPPETPPAVGSNVWCLFQGGDSAFPSYLPATGVVPDNAYPNLPPPVTSGGLQTYTDEALVIWVAKPGVNGGNWRQARDVLHARVYRAAAWTILTSGAASITWDGVYYDPYGIFDGATRLIALIPGLWEYHATVTVSYGANNYSIWAQAYLNGSRADFATTGPSIGGWTAAHVGGVWRCNTGDYFTMNPTAQGATINGGGGNDLTHAEFHWKATG